MKACKSTSKRSGIFLQGVTPRVGMEFYLVEEALQKDLLLVFFYESESQITDQEVT